MIDDVSILARLARVASRMRMQSEHARAITNIELVGNSSVPVEGKQSRI